MKYQIWYLKPLHLRTSLLGGANELDPRRLKRTHAHLLDLEINNAVDPLEEIFGKMQGEVWSPNGEARALIQEKSLQHTSMSVDDIIVDEAGRVYIVDAIGFRELM